MKRILIIVFCLLIAVPLFAQTPVYLERGNIFAKYFTEPVEKLIFIAFNGDSYALSNYTESSVSVNYDEFKELLKKDGLEIKDIMCVIHNHTGTLMKFSPRDLRFYGILKSDGFKGLFLLWSSIRQRVTDFRYSQ